MLFFQLPAMPLIKQAVSSKGKDKIGASTVSAEPPKGNALEGLSGGYMGKMLVYKSGAIKLKLGETLFDVSPVPVTKLTINIATYPPNCKMCPFSVILL